MNRTFIQFESDNETIKGVLHSNRVPGEGPDLPPDFMEVTDTPLPAGKTSWEELHRHKYKAVDGSFDNPALDPDQLKTAELKAKDPSTWTEQDKQDAQRLMNR